MKILHAYCLNNNLGDYALGMGVKNVFRELYDVALFAEVNIQGQIFDDYFINIINQKYDFLIIGGGGIIHGAHWPQGWFWLIEEENIKKIHIPFMVYGAGYNYFRNEEGIPERGVAHLRETQKRAAFFSVRNDGSYDRLLAQTGIDADVIADPGFFVPLNRSFPDQERKYVVVQLANDKPLSRFGTLENRDNFIRDMIFILRGISEEYRIIFTPHVYEDVELSERIASEVSNSSVINFGDFAFDRISEFIGIYKYADFVLAMRGHGQIVPLGFGVPVIALGHHDKHRGLMEEYGLGQYHIDIREKNFTGEVQNAIHLIVRNKRDIGRYAERQNSKLLSDTKSKLSNIPSIMKFLRNKVST